MTTFGFFLGGVAMVVLGLLSVPWLVAGLIHYVDYVFDKMNP